MFTQYDNETGKTKLTKLAKGGIIMVVAITSLGIFRLTAVKRIPANTVGVKVSAIGGVQENTLQTGYHPNRRKLTQLNRNRKKLRSKRILRRFKHKLKRMLASSKQKVKPRPTKLSQTQSQTTLSV